MNRGIGVEVHQRSRLTPDKALIYCFAMLVAMPAVRVLASVLQQLGIPHLPIIFCGYGVTFAFGLLGSWGRLSNVPRAVWAIAYVLVGALLLSAFRAVDGGVVTVGLGWSVAVCLAWMIVASLIIDYAKLLGALIGSAYAVLCGMAVRVSIGGSGLAEGGQYDQYIAYQLLPAVVILTDAGFADRRILPKVGSTLAWVLLISMGARGPVVVALMFVALRILTVQTGWRMKAGTLAALSAVGLALQNGLLDALGRFFQSEGLSTRVIDRQSAGNMFQDDARSVLAEESIRVLNENPVFGVGVANERVLLAQRMDPGGDPIGWYPHNFALEILVQFGLVSGSLILIVLLLSIMRALITGESPERTRVLVIALSVGMFSLLFSSSYLSWPWFFALLGFLISYLRQIRRSGLHRVDVGVG